ncbi:hypothetical protein BDV96DRAFT_195404 [Lophiotrema nucula]|uniref:Kinesin light chain n=1 Tax=Lophiotrema nucula TaxID=690887 RepID=A0A6A5YTV0_9PLEO|nr:hypothetical protein BDV96DRAFT_195404 [Lophiotrema nucula]
MVQILTSLPSLYRADFRLRRKITLSLETIVENTEGPHFEHASTTNAVEQLAICYRVGLGLTKQENAAHGFQQHDVGDRLRSTSTSQTLNQTGCNHGRQRHGFHGHGVKSHNYRRDAELLQMAISVLNNEVAQMEGIFETHHPIVLAHNQRLSQVLLDGGYLKEAAKVAEQVYKVSKRNYAENHPQLSLATQILARTYTAQRRWEEARGLVMRLLQRSPISDRNRFNCLFDLAMIHVGQSNWEHVESLGDQMYEIAKSGLGPSHVHTLACMHLLKDAYERQGKEGNKNNMEERLLKEKIKFYDKSSEEARSNTTRLHELYVAVGNSAALSRAETLLLQLLQESILAVGLEHPDTLDRRDGLADVYHRMYKYAQAREQLTEALAVRKRTLGERHIDTVNSMANLFQVYKSEESWKKCEELGSEVLKIREEILGAEHPDTWTAMSDLSRAFLGLNLFTAAEELDKRLLDLKITKLGELHQDTQVAAMNLAATYRTHAKHEETKAIYDQLNGAAYDIDHRMAVVRRKHMMSQVEQASGPTNLQTFLRDMKSPRAWRKKMGEIWKDSWSGFHDIDDPERNG